MNWKELHHPDFCLRVVRRNMECELLDLAETFGDLVVSRGRSLGWTKCYDTPRQFHAALWRLRRDGLIVRPSRRGETPGLRLTEEGRGRLDASALERRCSRPWCGRWNVLVYDVPESDRRYRDTFRDFLKRLRLGCLQRSVWVTPYDIRPEFQDLREAAAADDFAFLFESRTVLGLGPEPVVGKAWNWDRLERTQRWYLKECRRLEEAAARGSLAGEGLRTAAVEILAARHVVADLDPFLPQELWPKGYLGPEVTEAAHTVAAALRRALSRELHL